MPSQADWREVAAYELLLANDRLAESRPHRDHEIRAAAEAKWRQIYFEAMRRSKPGDVFTLYDQQFARTDDRLIVVPLYPERRVM